MADEESIEQEEEVPYQEYAEEETRTVVFTWHPSKLLSGVPYQSVYAFGFMNNMTVLGIRDENGLGLIPPEGDVLEGETPENAIKRIFYELTQLKPSNFKLLGVVEMEIYDLQAKLTDRYQQVRYYCEVEEDGKFVPKSNEYNIVERRFIPIEKARTYIEYLSFPIELEVWREALNIIDATNA